MQRCVNIHKMYMYLSSINRYLPENSFMDSSRDILEMRTLFLTYFSSGFAINKLSCLPCCVIKGIMSDQYILSPTNKDYLPILPRNHLNIKCCRLTCIGIYLEDQMVSWPFYLDDRNPIPHKRHFIMKQVHDTGVISHSTHDQGIRNVTRHYR